MDAAWMGGAALVSLGVVVLGIALLAVLAVLARGAKRQHRHRLESVLTNAAGVALIVAVMAALVFVGLVLLLAFGGAVGLIAAVWPW